MPKIDIDALCEPIEVRVGGKDYTIEDISPLLADRMAKVGRDAQKAQDAGDDPDPKDTKAMSDILAEIMGADKTVIAKLGMRKRLMLVTQIMGTINAEIEAKNVPEAEATKSPT